ncbi:hypothetical protein M3P05_17870 [Sansalvadorimonas sp. 2012CJ34-2]|uniref:Uncharacterized protein n=1 Tax=Parendozoicomonas callyspongiae TaxID=2942213 RepID=A0ABT0PK73_9GAMM|nr:hypothetical protein [Sansalvadorimonas sp. 2012CJ34-2]MCL6271790.1 hypothetical protein [Sansalvadorimonas sp. 2012CJ34-2]
MAQPQIQNPLGQPKRSVPKEQTLNKQLPELQTPMAIQYSLDDIKLPPSVVPGGILQVKMQGSVTLTSNDTLPVTSVVNKKEVEAKVTQQANHSFGKLISDTQLVYDNQNKSLKLKALLISKSNTPNTPATAFGVEADSNSPIPKLVFQIILPELKGAINEFTYTSTQVKLVAELTLTPQQPLAQPKRRPQPVSDPINWDRVIGTGLIIAATAIVVGTIVEDFLTFGAGVADDPASFAAAGVSYARGVALWRSTTVVIPKAIAPVITRLRFSIVPAGAVQYAR